jgi:hypothetical protein
VAPGELRNCLLHSIDGCVYRIFSLQNVFSMHICFVCGGAGGKGGEGAAHMYVSVSSCGSAQLYATVCVCVCVYRVSTYDIAPQVLQEMMASASQSLFLPAHTLVSVSFSLSLISLSLSHTHAHTHTHSLSRSPYIRLWDRACCEHTSTQTHTNTHKHTNTHIQSVSEPGGVQ